MYLYQDYGFGAYNIIGRIDYARHSDLIRYLREASNNGQRERDNGRSDGSDYDGYDDGGAGVRTLSPGVETESVGAAPANPSVGAADQNFTGRAAYQDLLSDENSQRDRPGDVRPVEVPKVDGYGRNVSEFVGNAYGSAVVPDNFTATIEELVDIGALGNDPKTDKETLHEAAEIIKNKGMAAWPDILRDYQLLGTNTVQSQIRLVE